MSKHVGRKKRWMQVNALTHTSVLGKVVFDRNAWWGVLDYKTLVPDRSGDMTSWVSCSRNLGPYKRPRNAMVALEREATALKNRHGKDILFGEQLWAEA